MATPFQLLNDVVTLSTSPTYNRPFCIDVLSNDIINSNTYIYSVSSGSGTAMINPPPVFIEPTNTITIEAESYHIINERSGTYYSSSVNGASWTSPLSDSSANNGYVAWVPPQTSTLSPPTYQTTPTTYGPAIGFNIILQNSTSSWKLFSRVRTDAFISQCYHHAYTRVANGSISFLTYNSTIQVSSSFSWTSVPFTVSSNEFYPNIKTIYVAMYSSGVYLDRISVQNTSSTPSLPSESPVLKCNSSKEIMYFPPAGFNGTDTLTYTITDNLNSSSATIGIYINIPIPSPSPSRSPSTSSSVSPTASVTPSVSASPSTTPNPPYCFRFNTPGSNYTILTSQDNANFGIIQLSLSLIFTGQTFTPPVNGKLFSVSFFRNDTVSTPLNGTIYLFSSIATAASGIPVSSMPFQITSNGQHTFNFTGQVSASTLYTALLDNLSGPQSVSMLLASSPLSGEYAILNGAADNHFAAAFEYCMVPDTWPSPSPTPSVSATPSSSAIPSSSSTPSVSSTLSPDKNTSSKKANGALIGGVVGGAVGLSSLAVIFGILMVKRRKKDSQQGPHIEMSPSSHYAGITPDDSSNYVPIHPDAKTSPSSERVSLAQNWNIKHKDLKFDKEIGKGAFGVVYKGTWQGVEVAIKKMLSEKEDVSIQDFLAEADLMMKLRPHPNITQLLGICTSPLCLVTEFVHNGSLVTWLKENTPTAQQMVTIARGIAAGMLYLHNEGVVHRDLAARNILLDKTLTPKVSDFGMSRVALDNKTNKTASEIGPIRWMAPEAMRQRVYNKKTDVWSYGTVLYEILTRKTPYSSYDLMQVAASVMMGELSLVPEVEENSDKYPKVILQVLKDCLKFKPEDRPLFDQILQDFDQQAQ